MLRQRIWLSFQENFHTKWPNISVMKEVDQELHAYLPECIDVTEGDEITIAECRPLSKTVSFVVIEGIKGIGT